MRIMYAMGSRSRMLESAAKTAGASTFSSSAVSDDVNLMFTAEQSTAICVPTEFTFLERVWLVSQHTRRQFSAKFHLVGAFPDYATLRIWALLEGFANQDDNACTARV